MPTITGTADGDDLQGTSGDDTIDGLGGGDVLVGLEGDDTLNGGDGNDIFLGGEGTDTYNGGAGRDVLFFSYVNGFDSAFFTDDLTIDMLAGTASFAGITEHFTSIEKFYLGDGNDTFYGSDQDDEVLALDGDDALHGGAGNDTLKGGLGDDVIYGDDGDDTLDGGNGQDMVYGGAGDDTITLGAQESAAPDTIDGGTGFDTLLIDSTGFGYTTHFAGSTITGMESIEGAFTETNSTNPTPDLETSVRVQFDAVFFQNNTISTVVSNAHDIDNWHFAITVVMGDETTVDLSALQFDANWNDFTPNGDVGDTITIYGDDSDETLIGSSRNDILFGGGGTDTFDGGAGYDTLTYGDLFGIWYDVLTDDLVVDMAAGTATFAGVTETFSGIERVEMGDGNDTFYGSGANDEVYGRGGNDTLHGGDGDDVLRADEGNDTLYGDGGRDYLIGGSGTDAIYGGADDDWIGYTSYDGFVTDTVDGGEGVDVLRISVETDDGDNSGFIYFDSNIIGIEALQADFLDEDWSKTLHLQFDAEFFRNNAISSVLSNAHDTDGRHIFIEVYMDDETTVDLSALQFDANWNDFTPNGEVGDSITIFGDDSDEMLIGSSRNDFLIGGGGTDTYDGGDGIDTLIYGDRDLTWPDLLYDDMVVDVAAGTASFAGITETFTSIERFYLGFANDTFTGSDGDEYVNGVDGDDTLYGGGGNDTLLGAIGDDALYGGDGNDRLEGGYGNDLLEGGAGHDVLIGGDGDDTLVGGDGQDVFFGGDGTDTFDGGEGTDSLYFGTYEDMDDGGQDYAIVVDVAAGTATYHWITETFTSIETFWLANGDDTFLGSDGNETVYGMAGNDNLSGGDGDDYLGGGAGDDTLTGGEGNDRIAGGVGTDFIDAGAGDDTVTFLSNEGDILDTVDGGDGTDQIQLVWVGEGPGYYSFGSSVSGFEEISFVFGAYDLVHHLQLDAAFFLNNSISLIESGGHYAPGQSIAIEIHMDGESSLDLSALQFDANWNDLAPAGEVGDSITIIGGDLGEEIIGSSQNDIIHGGAGNDTLAGGEGVDTYDGGDGYDSLNFGYVNGSSGDFLLDDMVVDMAAGTATFGGITETFTGIERVYLGFGNDTFYGTDEDNAAQGQGGDDVLYGGNGHDVFTGGDGNDTLIGGGGSDYLVGGAGADNIDGGAGDDWIVYTSADGYVADTVDGGDGNDMLQITVVPNDSSFIYFDSNFSGLETLKGYFFAGDWSQNLRLQFDAAFFQNNAITSVISTGHDVEGWSFGIEIFMDDESSLDLSALQFDENWNDASTGGSDYVSISGDATSETIIGSAVSDIIVSEGGDDTIYGGAGNDEIRMGFGRDSVYGGEGDDFLSTGLNYFEAGEVYDGGAGHDILSISSGFSEETIDFRIATIAGIEEFSFFLFADLNIQFTADQLTQSGLTTLTSLNSGMGGLLATIEVDMAGAGFFDASQMAFETADSGVPPLAIFVISGGVADEVMIGSSHHDEISGGAGDDVIRGGAGDDWLAGGDGHDRFDFDRGHGTDTIADFSLADDLIVLSGISQTELDAAFADRVADGEDTLLSFADGSSIRLQGIAPDDLTEAQFRLSVTDGNDTIYGHSGADMLKGLSGADDLVGFSGSDHLLGGDGSDRLVGGAGSDKLLGGDGADTFVLAADGSTDTISDFDFRMDHLEIVKTSSIQDMSDLTLTQDGRDLVITGEGLSVRLYDVSREALNNGHFVFVNDGDGFLATPQASTSAASAAVASQAKMDILVQLASDPEVATPMHDMTDDLTSHFVPHIDWYLDANDQWAITTGDDPGDAGWSLG